jgi:hypothetical protein
MARRIHSGRNNMNRAFLAIPFLLLSFEISWGQSSYKGLTPGKSTRAEVEQLLGKPIERISENLFEYANSQEQLYIQYSKTSPAAIRIQLIYAQPRERDRVLEAERLPRVADTRRVNKQGSIEEYFGYPRYIVLTFDGTSETTVSTIGYYSRELFEANTPELAKNTLPPQNSAIKTGPASRPSDIPFLNANVVALRLFESGAEPVDVKQRQYTQRFSQAATRGIYPELNLQFPDPGREITFAYEIVFYRDRELYHRRKCDTSIMAGWLDSNHSCGVGWVDAGKWKPGSYLVEVFIEGRKVAATSFEVY